MQTTFARSRKKEIIVNEKIKNTKSSKTRRIAIAGMLGAVTIVLGSTPLGFIPLGVFNITTVHIPVIIAAILEGPVVGVLVGLIFGITSLVKNLVAPTAISFIFWNPLISVLPRIMIGLLSAYFFILLKNLRINSKISYFLTGVFGTLVNTTLVLGGAYLLYAKDLVEKLSLPNGAGAFLFGIATANGVPEMIFSAVITLAVCTALVRNNK